MDSAAKQHNADEREGAPFDIAFGIGQEIETIIEYVQTQYDQHPAGKLANPESHFSSLLCRKRARASSRPMRRCSRQVSCHTVFASSRDASARVRRCQTI